MQNVYRRRILPVAAILVTFILLALGGRPAQAQDVQWLGQFWNNRDLAGPVIISRYENTIDFNWFGGSPHTLINDDNFSARWTRTVNFPVGTYRFFATMDDGMRVWIDNQLVIDSWTNSQEHTRTFDRFMNGNHAIRIDYFEAGGMAVARFNWQLLTAGGGGQFFPNWKGEYFNNTTLSGAPVLIRDDSATTHDWGLGSPGPGVNADFWSVRWTRQVSAQPGQYRIILSSDDGSRLFINNQLIIDNWREQATTSQSADFFAPGGVFEVRIEYFDAAGAAFFRGDLISVTGGLTSISPTFPQPPTGGGSCVTTPSGMQAQSNATATLNVRGGPSTQFEPISQLSPCQIVPLSGFRNAESTWVQVVLADGRTGWVSAQYLNLGAPIGSLTPSS